MGIEYQTTQDISKLYDLAKHQLQQEAIQRKKRAHEYAISIGKQKTFAEYYKDCMQSKLDCLIFSHVNNKLIMLKVDKEITPKEFSWSYSKYFPYVVL